MLPFPVLFAGTLVVYVLAPPGAEGTVEGTKASLRAALPSETVAEVHAVKELPEDTTPTRSGDGDQMTATLVWSVDGRTVTLQLRKANDAAAFRRELSFDPRDSAKERGRAAGFAIASMLEGAVLVPEIEPAVAPPTTKPREPRHESAPGVDVPPPMKPESFTLDAALSGSVGFGGAATGIGGVLGARARLYGPLWAHGVVSVRRGEVGAVRATSTFSQLGAGLYIGGPVAMRGRVSVGARADLLLEWQYLSHFSGDEPSSVGEGRVLPVFGVAGEGAFRATRSVELWLGIGPQIATGRTTLFMKGEAATQIPLLRGVFDLGFRAYF